MSRGAAYADSPRAPLASTGVGLTILAATIWGSSFAAVQVSLGYTSPVLLVALRFGLAGLLAVLVTSLVGRSGLALAPLRTRRAWWMGALYSSAFVLQFLGQSIAGIANSTLLSNLFPILAPVLAVVVLGDAFGARTASALAVGVVGLSVVALPGLTSSPATLSGDVLLLASSLAYALFIVASKKYSGDGGPGALSLLVVVGVLYSPVLLYTLFFHRPELTLPISIWLAIVYLAVPCSLVALGIYLFALRWISASRSAFLLLFEPIVGIVLATIWYRNSITGPILVGGTLIVGALAIANWPERGR